MTFVPFLQIYVFFAASDSYIHQIKCLKGFSVDIANLINQVLLIFSPSSFALKIFIKFNLSIMDACFRNVTATATSHSQQPAL